MTTTDSFDVLVIGCGPAGASAAIAAHDAGARIVVVEKRPSGGGNALVAGGFLWDVRGGEAVRHVETLFFGKTGRSVAEAYGTTVAGLYATGGAGTVWGSFTHSGGGLTDALVFGRLAGQHAAGA